MRELKLIVLVIFTIVAIVACGSSSTNNSTSNNANKAAAPNSNSAAPAGNTANTATTSSLDGKQIYTENCQICHKDTAKGGPVTVEGKKLKPADLTAGHSKKHSDDDIAKDISEGSPDDGMPAFKDKLKPDEIKAVVAYLRTLQQ